MRRTVAWIVLFAALALPAGAQQLILADFGGLKNLGPGRGESTLMGAFRLSDSADTLAATSYVDATAHIVVDVTVEKYAQPQWLLHEFEGAWREESGDRFAAGVSLVDSAGRRRFEADVLTVDKTTRSIAWVTDEAEVVTLRFSLVGANRLGDIPGEVLDAYVALYPSALPESVVDTPEHHRDWIRAEMDRILEYARRYFGYSETAPGPTPPEFFREIVLGFLLRFEGFRERFFGTGSQSALEASFGTQRERNLKPNGVAVNVQKELEFLQTRLTEFETWWQTHRNDPVRLPTPATSPTP